MPKVKISEYSATANSNTDVASINIDEGCAPSGINNAIRAIMGHLKDFQQGTYGDPFNGPVNGALNGTVGATTPSTGAFTTLSASGNVTLGDASTDTLNVGNGGLVKDASGNLGLGVTPSVQYSGIKSLQVGSTTNLFDNGASTKFYHNAYTAAAGDETYLTTGYAQGYLMASNGQHQWYTAASGTAGTTFSFTQAMTLDASGNLGIGATSPGSFAGTVKLVVGSAASTTTPGAVTVYSGTATYGGLYFADGTVGDQLYRGAVEYNHSTDALLFYSAGADRARIDSSGNLLVGTTTGSNHYIAKAVAEGSDILGVISTTTNLQTAYFMGVTSAGENAAASAIGVRKNGTTLRSINAGGTINAAGTDYAEYMTKAGDFTVAKGDVVGIDANGELTNVFADSVSFMVKSTDPSYVGGDSWGSEEAIGLSMPKKPSQRQATEEVEAETDEEFAARFAQYEADQSAFDAALEAARQRVDRIAFAGQVPVNVTGATAGQYIIPVNDNGAIKGEAVSNPTFEQYQIAVGKVIAIESDGRAKIIVKVA